MRRIDRSIGTRVRTARRRAGLTQRQLAGQLDISPTTINRLERGLQSIYVEILADIARVLGVSLDALAGMYDEEKEPAA